MCVTKMSKNLSPSDVFFHFQAPNAPKPCIFGRRYVRDPAGGTYNAPPPSSRLGMGASIPIPCRPRQLRFLGPLREKFQAMPMDAIPDGNNDSHR